MNTKIKNINNIFSLIKEKRKELSIQIKELEKDVKREKTGGAEKIKKEIAKLQSQLKELE